ncbi:unnamed protein product [Linum trigynum]|uniref:Uncharacterized protein n=1 Tax=Linum trigynum TaxID=586398 RepID=A0AAV2CWN8_9ROSI
MKEATTPEEQVNFLANARANNQYSNTYNPGWRNHLNFAWSSPTNPRPSGFQGSIGNHQPRRPSSNKDLKSKAQTSNNQISLNVVKGFNNNNNPTSYPSLKT